MAKAAKTVFVCEECGGQVSKWQGQCPHCQAWNSLSEQTIAPAVQTPARFAALAVTHGKVQTLSEVSAEEAPRFSTSIDEFDRALGGGLVRGAVVLIGGDPGIGKSTLLLQTLAAIGSQRSVLYVTGEESPQQIALRAQRLAVSADSVRLLAEIRTEQILACLQQEQPQVVVIDSIQTVYTETLSSAPGSVSQVRECAAQLTRYAKSTGCTMILVGHVTKEGALAGPRVLEHIVDSVLYFEGDTHSNFRMIRAVKNRFGAVNELGVFAMTERGLRGVSNPSAMFLSSHRDDVPGSCVLVTQEGTRPLLVEIQALVDEAHAPQPRRLTVGLEQNRLAMLLAVLHRHGGVACFDRDVFINAVGGVRISEPASDLAVLLAIVSSLRDKALPEKMVVFGEVGLGGEVRPVARGQERLREAAKLGFTRAIIPTANRPKQSIEGMTLVNVDRLDQALAACREFS
jgi:DNA repair protein RadA/Sms